MPILRSSLLLSLDARESRTREMVDRTPARLVVVVVVVADPEKVDVATWTVEDGANAVVPEMNRSDARAQDWMEDSMVMVMVMD